MIESEWAHHSMLQQWAQDLRARSVRVWDLDFQNPVGLAAGFDKHAEYLDVWQAAGFGFVEIGSVTSSPCKGNPPPRWFSFPEQEAMVNTIGCHSQGHAAVANRLEKWRSTQTGGIKIGVNLASQPGHPSIDDFVGGVRVFAPLADYLTLNISCPNVADGTCYQNDESALERLLDAVWATGAGYWQGGVPIVLKVGLDLSGQQCEMIARHPADGLVIANTMRAPSGWPKGGLSGRPIREPAERLLAKFYRLTEVPLIGVGGIACAEDAYARIKSGARLLQLHTALAFQGLSLVRKISHGLAQQL